MLNFIKEKSVALVLHRSTNYLLAISIFMCFVFYIYFANTAVHTLTILERIQEDFQSLGVKVSDMEAKRLSVQNSISKSLAQSLGLVEISSQTFIMSKSKSTTLSYKTD